MPKSLPGLRPGFFGSGFGRSLGEGRGLAFAGAALFIEQARQVLDLGAELSNFAFEADTGKAWGFGHTFTLSASVLFRCASLPRKCVDFKEPEATR